MSKLSRTVLGGLATTALCGVGVAAAMAPAQAEPEPGTPVVTHSAAAGATEQDRVSDYWTPERMRGATPAQGAPSVLEQLGTGGLVATGSPEIVPQAAAATPLAADDAGADAAALDDTAQLGEYFAGDGKVTVTTGKVFFTGGGSDWVCSGSAVSSANKDVVLSAGHCAFEGDEWATNWTFVPGYDDGAAPYGKFTARELLTTQEWQDANFDYDVSFAVMNTLDGKHLTDVVGGQAIGFNQPSGEHMYDFGYPAEEPYDGTDLAWCHGVAGPDTFGGSGDYDLACNLTGGSSGGPWLSDYDATTGEGTLTSVNSFGYVGYDDHMFGPYFGSAVQSLYDTAASL